MSMTRGMKANTMATRLGSATETKQSAFIRKKIFFSLLTPYLNVGFAV